MLTGLTRCHVSMTTLSCYHPNTGQSSHTEASFAVIIKDNTFFQSPTPCKHAIEIEPKRAGGVLLRDSAPTTPPYYKKTADCLIDTDHKVQ
jgi:hypothetical protein